MVGGKSKLADASQVAQAATEAEKEVAPDEEYAFTADEEAEQKRIRKAAKLSKLTASHSAAASQKKEKPKPKK